jgi:formylmethanofuran dehydrogenase subunit E
MISTAASAWEAQLGAYQKMPDENLLRWEEVALLDPNLELPGQPGRVVCAVCGDVIHEHHEVMIGDQAICKPCAYGAYYAPVGVSQDARYAGLEFVY